MAWLAATAAVVLAIGTTGTTGTRLPPPPPPVLTATNFSRGAFAAPAFLTNGLLGLRPGPIPLLAGPFAGAPPPLGFDPTVAAVVAGFMYRDVSLNEVVAPAPYPFATAVLVDGRDVLRASDAKAVPLSQTFDMGTGELHTQFEISSRNVTVVMNATMFVSRSMPTLAAMRVTAAITSPLGKNLTLAPALSLHFAAARAIDCGTNATDAGAGLENCSVPAVSYNDTIPGPSMPGWAAWVWDKNAHRLGAVTNLGSRVGLAAAPNLTTTAQGSVIYECLVSVVSSAVSGDADPVHSAYTHVERAMYLGGYNLYSKPTPGQAPPPGGFAELRRKNRAAWAALWEARPLVSGPDVAAIAADQRMIDGAFFYMHSHAHPSNTMGVADYGLSAPGRMYEGGIMEDFDALMVLPVALADAAAGAAFARFRTRTLAAAQELAAANGYVGLKGRRPALFAAGVSMVDGHLVESAFESWAKDYVGLFVALAVYEAASAAADPTFVRDEAWPLLRAVAEFVVARGEWTARGFEFGLSMNRDEDKPRVTDASTLSLFGMRVLEVTIECHETLPDGWRDIQAAKNWAAVLAAIYVPVDDNDVILPFAGAVNNNGTTPRTWSLGNLQQLLAHGVPARLSAATLRATLQAEEDLRSKWTAAHAADPKANPATICQGEYMSCPPMAQAAAMLGDRTTAGTLLRKLATNQTLPPFDIVSEYPCGECGAGHGIYMTNVGSFLSTLYALAGVQAKMGAVAQAWIVRNATLPSGWDSLSFGRVELGGDTAYRLDVVHGARATLTPVPEKRCSEYGHCNAQ